MKKNEIRKGYYKPEIIAKFNAALKAARENDNMRVSISAANSKMGAVASVSLLPFLTCPACCADSCGRDCYAAKLANLRPNVRDSWARNTAILLNDPASYWIQVRAAVAGVRFFRFHVSGDIISADYFAEMVKTAKMNPHCEILAFTKRFSVVNDYIAENGDLPANLHIMFSGWANLTPDNPYHLPETIVYNHGDEIAENWLLCGGNCFNCGCRGLGCWKAAAGDVIAFAKH